VVRWLIKVEISGYLLRFLAHMSSVHACNTLLSNVMVIALRITKDFSSTTTAVEKSRVCGRIYGEAPCGFGC